MYDQNGDPIDGGVAEMIEALRDRYGADNIVAELLIDNIAADFWRQNKGLEAELSFFSQGRWAFYPKTPCPRSSDSFWAAWPVSYMHTIFSILRRTLGANFS